MRRDVADKAVCATSGGGGGGVVAATTTAAPVDADAEATTDDDEERRRRRWRLDDVARLHAVLGALVETKALAIRADCERAEAEAAEALAAKQRQQRGLPIVAVLRRARKHRLSVDNVRSLAEGLAASGGVARAFAVPDPEAEANPPLPTVHDECEVAAGPSPSRKQHRHCKEPRHHRRHHNHHHEHRHHRHLHHRHGHHHRTEDDDDGDRDEAPDQEDQESKCCWYPDEHSSSPERLGGDACSGASECVVVLERERACTRSTRSRARRKQRRRRRRERAQLLAEAAEAAAEEERVKVLDPDELPQRARWTIMVTACLLLFLCLFLVGVTLRMAPLIDDMVRQENERMMHESLNIGTANVSQPLAAQLADRHQ